MTQEKNTPRHEHDCSLCVFLGHFGDFDLYFHECKEHPTLTTVVARFGELGDYYSGLAFAASPDHPELREARERAIAAGFGAAIAKAEGQS